MTTDSSDDHESIPNDGHTDGHTNGHTDGPIVGPTDGPTDGHTDGSTDRHTAAPSSTEKSPTATQTVEAQTTGNEAMSEETHEHIQARAENTGEHELTVQRVLSGGLTFDPAAVVAAMIGISLILMVVAVLILVTRGQQKDLEFARFLMDFPFLMLLNAGIVVTVFAGVRRRASVSNRRQRHERP